MKHRASIRLENVAASPLRIVLEPYASEFMLPSGSTCEIVGRSEGNVPDISIEYTTDAIVFWGQTTQAIYEYWQDGKLVE
jgi:hypothetical protein